MDVYKYEIRLFIGPFESQKSVPSDPFIDRKGQRGGFALQLGQQRPERPQELCPHHARFFNGQTRQKQNSQVLQS